MEREVNRSLGPSSGSGANRPAERKSPGKNIEVRNGIGGRPSGKGNAGRKNLYQEPLPIANIPRNAKRGSMIFFFDRDMEGEDLQHEMTNKEGTCVPVSYSVSGDGVLNSVAFRTNATAAAVSSKPDGRANRKSRKSA